MHTLNILIFLPIMLLELCSLGRGNFHLTVVTYIKEIRNHGKTLQLEENNIVANTEEKRLNLCRDGFKEIQKHESWGAGEKAVFLQGTAPEILKVYIFKDIDYHRCKAAPAFKCPTDPELYIHINFNKGNRNQPAFRLLYKKRRPLPILERIMYKMMRVTEIIQVDATDLMSASENTAGIDLREFPIYDTDELTDNQRLEICVKAVQTSPKLDINLIMDTKTSTNKYYSVTTFSTLWSRENEVIEAFECPTEPKIYISMGGELFKMGLLWVLIKTTDGYRLTTDVEELKARSPKETAEAFYHQIRNANEEIKVDQVIDPDIHTTMCRSTFQNLIYERSWIEIETKCRILTSVFFLDTYDVLKKENMKLFERYYKNSDSVFKPGQDVIIVNGPESTDVTVPETQESLLEDVFVCLIRSDRTHMEEYFVSKEYNMNYDSKNSPEDYKAGRFFFKRNPNNAVVMMGMVEEFAAPIETSNLELLFLKRRKTHKIAKTDSDDPLCKLNSFERSRVCNLVSQVMVHEQFQPIPLHDLGCAKNPITFTSKNGIEETEGDQYYEWMITCYESFSKYGSVSTYYLSQAYDKSDASSSNDVFAYNRPAKSGKIYLQNAYTDPRIGKYLENK